MSTAGVTTLLGRELGEECRESSLGRLSPQQITESYDLRPAHLFEEIDGRAALTGLRKGITLVAGDSVCIGQRPTANSHYRRGRVRQV